jgi:acetyl-CoA carboxylase biotin carboxylase subunit
VPVIPGGEGELASLAQARAAAAEAGYPVMLKAAAGGGGKGMRRVDRELDLAGAFRDASSEAERSFRNPAMYLEKLLVQPRHIEVQVLGDHHGHMIHLGERECSVQRRHQKLIEESPSPLVAEYLELRDQPAKWRWWHAGPGTPTRGRLSFWSTRISGSISSK